MVGVSIGGYHTLALREDRTLWAWGNNSYGSLGDGTTISRFASQQVTILGPVIGFSAGDAHSLALTADGKVWAWGGNSDGELGNMHVRPQSSLPVQVEGLTEVTAITHGFTHGLALKRDGTRYCVARWVISAPGHGG